MFGQTELPHKEDRSESKLAAATESKASGEHGITTSPHSITNSASEIPLKRVATPSKMPLIAAAVVVFAGGGFYLSQSGSAADDETNATAPPVEEPNSDNVVRVQISTLPPDAELFLDDEPISNPFDGELEKDKKSHQLVAKREGFIDSTRKLVLTAGQRVFLQLQAKETDKKPEEKDDEPKKVVRPLPRLAPVKPPPAAPTPLPVPVSAPAPAPPPAPAPAPAELKKIF